MPTNTLIITSPYQLSQVEIKTVLKSLGVDKQPGMVVKNNLDKSLLGGMIVKYNGYYLDLSLKNKLKDIVNNLS